MASPSPAEAAARRQAGQAAIARHAAQVATDAWLQVDPARIAQSWAVQFDRAFAAVAGGQLLAAQSADGYINEALAAQGIDTASGGVVDPRRLAGIASDGRPLTTLLREPVVRTLEVIGQGVPPAEALRAGQVLLDMIVRTQVADAGRAATGIGITSRGVGYTRQLTPPSCSRCVLLAGKFYRWNTGFQRHPRCDCIHVPTTGGRSRELTRSPRGYFDSLTAAEQDRTFGKAGAQAIRDGSDVGQVVNARRGMTAAGTTTESTTRRGVAARGRLMPEEIYRRSQGDRDEALRLLRLHGYLR